MLEHTALHSAGGDGAASGDGEDVLDRHKEGLVGVALRIGNVAVDCVKELLDAVESGIVPLAREACFHRFESGTADDGGVVAGEAVLVEEFAHFHLDQLKELFVVDLIALVQEHDDVGHADLTGKQDVLTGLRHGTVGRRNDEDGAVHLRRAGDHVLDIVGVAGAVNVRIVTLHGLVLDVRGVDRDASGFLFGRLVDLIVLHDLGLTLGRAVHGDGGGKSGLAVVNVADGADVDMGFSSFKLRFCHFEFLQLVVFE